MRFFETLKSKKIFFLQVFFVLYIIINLIGGERGLISYFEKNAYEKKLSINNLNLKNKLEDIEHKNKLLSKNINLDYLDTLYRSKLKFGTKDEILIKLK
ncbi:septation ring formation regulator EzrA [Pelagibacteraceae bacterium]|nr:septation ring formation regulator EzrA [Pelagibacteraceae bacterium]MDC0426839.1 septation ring formation regulator EzrA [Pelagibacteraceae bacterium]